jgi:hypothetical protein
VPPNFTAYISVDTVTGTYKWVGRDGEGDLNALCDWWLSRKDSCKVGTSFLSILYHIDLIVTFAGRLLQSETGGNFSADLSCCFR